MRLWANQSLARGEQKLLDNACPTSERVLIRVALEQTGGHRQDAARLLGWGRNTLTRKIRICGWVTTQYRFVRHVRRAAFRPEIPLNTGNIIRLCANTGARLHLIEPLGFRLEDRRLRRAGLDYHEWARVRVHPDLTTCLAVLRPARVLAFTTKGHHVYSDIGYQAGDALLFGRKLAACRNRCWPDCRPNAIADSHVRAGSQSEFVERGRRFYRRRQNFQALRHAQNPDACLTIHVEIQTRRDIDHGGGDRTQIPGSR